MEQNSRGLSKKARQKLFEKNTRKVIEIKGNRLEPFHLNAIRNEIEEEEEQRRTNKYKEEKK